MIEKVKEILEYIELSAQVTLANTFEHITPDEAGLHYASIAKQICQLFEEEVK